MKVELRNIVSVVGTVVVAVITFKVLSLAGFFDYDVWQRQNPLVSPVAVTSVREGTITLADGRVFRPAGVTRHDGVPAEDYDKALRVIVAQGVTVVRDLGDGRAFLLAEPKFFNSCGTRGDDGNPWKRWAGSYVQCRVSELLIQTAYAIPAPDQASLTERERWRLEGVEHFPGVDESTRRIAESLVAFQYTGSERHLGLDDSVLESIWKPSPSR